MTMVPLPVAASVSVWMLVGTSCGQIWRITKMAKLLSLSAKAVKQRPLLGRGNDNQSQYNGNDMTFGNGYRGGRLVGRLYNYLFTPSKWNPTLPTYDNDNDDDYKRKYEDNQEKHATNHPTLTSRRNCPVLALLLLPSPADVSTNTNANAAPLQPYPWKYALTSDNAALLSSLSMPHAQVLPIHYNPLFTFCKYCTPIRRPQGMSILTPHCPNDPDAN